MDKQWNRVHRQWADLLAFVRSRMYEPRYGNYAARA
jgi:hypothetical protein